MNNDLSKSSNEADDQQTGNGKPPTKRPRGRPFTSGDDPRIKQNMEAAARAAEAAGVQPGESGDSPEGAPEQLRDMRHVYSQSAIKDRTPGQKACRQWLKADVKGFMSHKSKLEAELLAATSRSKENVQPEEDEIDEGSERVRQLITQILEKAREEEMNQADHRRGTVSST